MIKLLGFIKVLALLIAGIWTLEWAITFALSKQIERGNIHLAQRLDAETIDWGSLSNEGLWSCKTFSKYTYAYHTCFRPFGDVMGYYFYPPKPYIGFGLLLGGGSDNFRYQTLSALGRNSGQFVGIVDLSGSWERCVVKRMTPTPETGNRYCERASNLKLLESGIWKPDQME